MTTWEDFSQKLKKDNPEKLAIIKTLADLESERIKQGISQKDFAEKIGMKQPQLAKIERLDSLPTLATLNRYARGCLLYTSPSPRDA